MSVPLEFIKKHKVAVIGSAVAVVVLYMIERNSGGGSSASSGSGLQLAQLQASQDLQEAQAQSQQNIAQINANAQTAGVDANAQAQRDTIAAQLASAIYSTGSQAAIEKEQIDLATTEFTTNSALAAKLAPVALKVSQQGGRLNSQTGENELALILNPGSASAIIPTFNSATASEPVGTSLGQLLAGIGSTFNSVAGIL